MYIDVYTDMYSVYTCVARAPGHSPGHSPEHISPKYRTSLREALDLRIADFKGFESRSCCRYFFCCLKSHPSQLSADARAV